MPRYAYDRLTALDNSFLILERPNAYMHVASTLIFEAGPLRTADGGVDAEAHRKRLDVVGPAPHPALPPEARVDPVSRATRSGSTTTELQPRLPHPPHGAAAARAPRSSSSACPARIMQQHLDRARPLWEMWVVEGLEGDRFAIISKVHHCMIDGISGVDILRVLLSLSPERRRCPRRRAVVPRPGAVGARAAARRDGAPRRAAARDRARRARPHRARRRDACARAWLARPRASPRRSAAALRPAVGDAAQPRDRPAPPLRLAARWTSPRSRTCARRSAAR